MPPRRIYNILHKSSDLVTKRMSLAMGLLPEYQCATPGEAWAQEARMRAASRLQPDPDDLVVAYDALGTVDERGCDQFIPNWPATDALRRRPLRRAVAALALLAGLAAAWATCEPATVDSAPRTSPTSGAA